MKKLILPVVFFIFFVLVFPTIIFAEADEASPTTKSPSGYDPKCWKTHMIDQMLVCSKAHGSCIKPCPMQDLKANALCLTECNNVLKVCYKKSSEDYKVCIEAEKRAKKQQETKRLESKATQAPSKKPVIQNKSNKSNPFNIFGINPYETWLNIQSFAYLNSSLLIEDIEMYALDVTGHKVASERMEKDLAIREGQDDTSKPDEQNQTNTSEVSSQELKDLGVYASVDELLNRTPETTEEIVKKAQADWEQMTNSNTDETTSPYRLDILSGQIQIKFPGQNEWLDLKRGDIIPPGSTIFTGMDTTTVLSIKDKGVVQILPFTEVTISEEGLAEPGKTTIEIDLRAGEVELNLPSGIFTGSLQVLTANAVAGVKGTHFWVSYNKDKKLSTVGVYEGEVEVKTRDGQTSTVSPRGDRPGVMVVAQKLSVTKLAVAGFVLAAIFGGTAIFLKRKFFQKATDKRKRN